MTNPLDAIKNLVGSATTASTLRWLVCRHCGKVTEHDMAHNPPVAPCSMCGGDFSVTTLPSMPMAHELSKRIAEERKAAGSTVPVALAPEVAKAPEAPKVPEAVAPEKLEPKPTEQPKTEKKARARKEPKPEPQTAPAAVLDAVPQSVVDSTAGVVQEIVGEDRVDWKQLREDAKVALLKKFPGINPVTFVRVAVGRVVSVGYTVWNDGKPEVDWMEPFDSPQSFAERFRDAQASHPSVSVDAAKVGGLPSELQPLGFNGEVSASTRDIRRDQGIVVAPRSRVEIGVRLTKSGGLAWSVMAVVK